MGKRASDIMQYGLMILAFIAGWVGYSYINQVSSHTGGGFWWILAVIFVTVVALIIGLFLHLILHEAGHLIGGLLSGYRFVFFNVLSLTVIKENGKLVRKKYSAPGALGCCLLSPPDMKNGTYPHKLYISGGFLVNFLVSAICISLFYCYADSADFWARVFLVFGIVGAFFGIINFIPQKVLAVSDGYVFFHLGNEKNVATRRALWSYMRIQTLDTEGISPRNIPVELFDWVDINGIEGVIDFQIVCKRYEYLLARQEMNEAKTLMQALCDNSYRVADVQKVSCYGELLFLELIGECRQEEITRLYTKELKDYIKTAHSELNVLRLMYAYTSLALKDEAKAKEYLDLFNKACAVSIWSGMVRGEQTLMLLIDTIACKRKKD